MLRPFGLGGFFHQFYDHQGLTYASLVLFYAVGDTVLIAFFCAAFIYSFYRLGATARLYTHWFRSNSWLLEPVWTSLRASGHPYLTRASVQGTRTLA